MLDIKYLPISCLDETLLQPLMAEEEKSWMTELDWDYSPIRQILVSFIKQKLLPGYVAVSDNEAIAYTYFLVNKAKGTIGALYAQKSPRSQEAIEELLSLSLSSLKGTKAVSRVEAQIIPFNNFNFTAAFSLHGFSFSPRCFLDLDIGNYSKKVESPSVAQVIPWHSSYLRRVAEMTLLSYRGQTDAEICEDYRTETGCESYLRSLVENPGCGIFMPESSYIALDWQGAPCGFIICCRISNGAAIIPQIAVHPSHQGIRLGDILMNRTLSQIKAGGFRTVSLTVTKNNLRAFEWYQRLGFKPRKDFGAYVWER